MAIINHTRLLLMKIVAVQRDAKFMAWAPVQQLKFDSLTCLLYKIQ